MRRSATLILAMSLMYSLGCRERAEDRRVGPDADVANDAADPAMPPSETAVPANGTPLAGDDAAADATPSTDADLPAGVEEKPASELPKEPAADAEEKSKESDANSSG